jgi:hypothetical protein
MKATPLSFGLAACAALVAALAGCASADAYQSRNSGRPAAINRVLIADDYDYYPRYEIYYSRHRNEYVIRERGWVRRIDLNGAIYRKLRDGPAVPMDFRDSPEFHHAQVVQRYPRNWEPPPRDQERANEDRKDRDDEHDRREGRRDDRVKG